MYHAQKGFSLPVVVILCILAGAGVGTFIFSRENTPITSTNEVDVKLDETSTQQTDVVSDIETIPLPEIQEEVGEKTLQKLEVPTPTALDATDTTDIQLVTAIMEDIKKALLAKDSDAYLKHATEATRAFFSSPNSSLTSVTQVIVNRIYTADTYVIVEMTITKNNGAPSKQSMVFIKENGVWKFDLEAGIKQSMSSGSSAANAPTSNSTGVIDFVITDIEIYPTQPVVNDQNVEILVHIKNIGTKTSEHGVTIEGEFMEFKDSVPSFFPFINPITPGQTVTWSFKPYAANEFFKITDTAGTKTFKAVVNENHDISESNYENNEFTQSLIINRE